MSSHARVQLIGIRDLSGTFDKMLQIKKYCETREVSLPKEVSDYFGDLII